MLLATGVLSWEDVLKHKGARDTVVWFSALVMMASFLGKLGLIGWLSQTVGNGIDHMGMSWVGGTILLTLIYLYSHYFFASTTAHVTAMFAAFFAAGIALGAPPAAGPDHGVLFLADDVADALRHRHRADHLRLRLRDAGGMVESGAGDERG